MNYLCITKRNEFPDWLTVNDLALFLHEVMKPYNDTVPDVERALKYALSEEHGKGGFIILASEEDDLKGAVVILNTGMSGYIPEHILLFIAVRPELRGRGIGGKLMDMVREICPGNIKLHVEHDNPARRLYERQGFTSKYLEMRLTRK
jgi:[ribosomal protein S18]-alanine N-acetyltransferase